MQKSSLARFVLAALVVVGCSSTTYYGPLPSDGGASDGGVASSEGEDENTADAGKADARAPKDAATSSEPVTGCKRTTTGALVSVDNNPGGNLPDATGGTVPDGHYVMTQAILMGSGNQPKQAGDLWLGGGRYEWQRKDADGWHFSYGGTVKFSGTKMVMTVDCGGQQSAPSWDYSIDGSDLMVSFTTINGLPWVYVLTRE